MLTSKKTIIKISHFADFEQAINKISHFVDCEQIKKLTAKRPWEKPDAYAFFCFGHPRFYECIGIQFFSSLTCDLRNAMSRQRSHTHMCLTAHPATPEVTYTHTCDLRDIMPRKKSLTIIVVGSIYMLCSLRDTLINLLKNFYLIISLLLLLLLLLLFCTIY